MYSLRIWKRPGLFYPPSSCCLFLQCQGPLSLVRGVRHLRARPARLDPKQALTGRIGELLHPPRVLAGGFRAGLRGILRTYRLRFQSSGAPGGRTPRVPRGCLTALLTAPHAARPASLQSRPEKADQGRPLPATGVRTHGPWLMAHGTWRRDGDSAACTVVNTDDVDDVLGGGPGPTPGRAGIALALATRALFGGLKNPTANLKESSLPCEHVA